MTIADTFIEQATVVHNGFYSYADACLIEHYKAKITCPEHGAFFQNIYNHLAGKGCKQCRSKKLANKYRKSRETFQYIKSHDNIKRNFCLKKNIPLLEIKYNNPTIDKLINDFHLGVK